MKSFQGSTDERVGPHLVNVRTFAEMLGYGLTKAWEIIGAGEVMVVRHNRSTRVRLDSIKAFIDANTVKGAE